MKNRQELIDLIINGYEDYLTNVKGFAVNEKKANGHEVFVGDFYNEAVAVIEKGMDEIGGRMAMYYIYDNFYGIIGRIKPVKWHDEDAGVLLRHLNSCFDEWCLTEEERETA